VRYNKLDKAEFLQFRKAHTQVEVARHYGISERSVRDWEKKLEGVVVEDKPEPAIAFPANADHQCLVGKLTVYAEKCLVIGDCEIPDHSIQMFENIVTIGRRFAIEDLIINGDFLALDSCSNWPKVAVDFIQFRQELKAAKMALKVFLQTFKRITWITGNHERRLAYKFDGQLNIGDFIGDIENVRFSEYTSCILKSGGREAYITHQKNYSQIPLSVPRKLIQARHMDILCAHNHHLALGYDPSGQYWLAEGGYCRDRTRTVYKEINTTTHPEWNPGFVMIQNGMPYLIDQNNLDFWMSVKSGMGA
jgi:hypothetical protein